MERLNTFVLFSIRIPLRLFFSCSIIKSGVIIINYYLTFLNLLFFNLSFRAGYNISIINHMNVGYVVYTHTVQTFSVCMEIEVSNTSRSEFEKNLKKKTGKQNNVFSTILHYLYLSISQISVFRKSTWTFSLP